MKLIIIFSFIFVWNFPAAQAKEVDPNDAKAVCAQTKAEIKQLEEEQQRAVEELKPIEARQGQAKQRFEEFRTRLRTQSGCSKGNPGNTAECEEILAGLAKSGDEISKIQDEMVAVGKKKDAVESKLLLPNEKLKAYRCQ